MDASEAPSANRKTSKKKKGYSYKIVGLVNKLNEVVCQEVLDCGLDPEASNVINVRY